DEARLSAGRPGGQASAWRTTLSLSACTNRTWISVGLADHLPGPQVPQHLVRYLGLNVQVDRTAERVRALAVAEPVDRVDGVSRLVHGLRKGVRFRRVLRVPVLLGVGDAVQCQEH